ncbi:MAG: DUF4159 domain-containing protein, partial [Planctomycetota bacterium]
MRNVVIAVLVACLLTPATGLARFSDAAVQDAIEGGVRFLCDSQRGASWPYPDDRYSQGPTALATYALLESLDHVEDEKLRERAEDAADRALKWMAEGGTEMTYGLGLRCQAFLSAIKRGKPYHRHLRKDVETLIKSTKNGGYGYHSRGPESRGRWDNSNSQYGLLGVWGGRAVGWEIPGSYWRTVYAHWYNTQNPDGGWGYSAGKSATRATMTAAGVASMYVCFDNLFAEQFADCDLGRVGEMIQNSLQRGLEWFDRNFRRTVQGGGNKYYYLYGIERIGVASGYKYFGPVDWYKAGATWLLRHQHGGGGWRGGRSSSVSTSFALLFLVRGRRPVLFNKLTFDGDWNNRPRDLASLTRWLSQAFEQPEINWQIINLDVPPRLWHDAPILYISGSQRIKLSAEQIERIRRFVYQGGTIFSVTECRGGGFRRQIRDAYEQMFPRYELEPLSPDHEIYTRAVQYELSRNARQLNLQVISNGVRPLVIHTDADLGRP